MTKHLWRLSSLSNLILLGSSNETMSSRCYRLRHIRWYRFWMHFWNWVFRDPNHCRTSYLYHQLAQRRKDEWRHYSPEEWEYDFSPLDESATRTAKETPEEK